MDAPQVPLLCHGEAQQATEKPKLSNLKNLPPPNGPPAGILGPDLV